MHIHKRSHGNRGGWFACLGLLIALGVFFAMPAHSVFADGGTPEVPAEPAPAATDEPVAEPDQPPAEEAQSASGDETAASGPAEGEPAAGQTAMIEPEVDDPAASDPAALQSLPQALDEAGLALATSSGDPMPLVEQTTAQAVANPDPYILIGSTKHYFLHDCTGFTNCEDVPDEINPIQAAIDAIANGVKPMPTDRAIHVEAGEFFSPNPLSIDAVTHTSLRQLSALLGAGSGVSKIGDSLSVSGLTNGFTLKGFSFYDGASVKFTGNTGSITVQDVVITSPTGTGLQISGDDAATTPHNGAITLKDVDISGSPASGAVLVASGAVSITSSSFIDNGTGGDLTTPALLVKGTGVTLNGVSISGNAEQGAQIHSSGAITVRNSIFTENGQSDDPALSALTIEKTTTTGSVTLDNLTLVDNYGRGLWVKNAGGGSVVISNIDAHANGGEAILVCPDAACTTAAAAAVTLTNTELVNNGTGAAIVASGNVTISGMWANQNGHGLRINACVENPDTHACTTGGAVTITNGEFNHNDGGDGLVLQARGAITLTNVTASYNAGNSVWASNAFTGSTGGISITNSASTPSLDHNGAGVNLSSNGAIKLVNVHSSHNAAYGMILSNRAAGNPAISVTSTTGTGAISSNAGNGLEIITNGAVVISSLSVSNNTGFGVRMGATDAPVGAVGITRLAVNDNTGHGIRVISRSAVKIVGFQANRNGGDGLYVENCLESTLGCTGSGSVTVEATKGWLDNTASNNNGDGVHINSRAGIALNIYQADGNQGDGVSLSNGYTNARGTISLASPRTGSISGNTDYGVYCFSKESISIRGYLVNNNGWNGLYLNTYSAVVSGAINVTGVTANRNHQTGIEIIANGPVTLVNVESSENHHGNHQLSNNRTQRDILRGNGVANEHPISVTTPGNQIFKILPTGFDIQYQLINSNTLEVLASGSGGANSVTMIEHNLNAGNYTLVVNTTDLDGGFYLINWNDVNFANRLVSYILGISIDACTDGFYEGKCPTTNSQGNVSITNNGSTPGHVDKNPGGGILVRSIGKVTITNMTASGNFFGIDVQNVPCLNCQAIVINKVTANRNYDNGLWLVTRGGGVITDTTASHNCGGGVRMNATIGFSPVTLARVTANANEMGMDIRANWTIVASDLTANDNKGPGVLLSNYETGFYPVTLKGNNEFNNNLDYGLKILARGAITVTNVDACNNTHTGMEAAPGVTLSNYFLDPYGDAVITKNMGGGVSFTNIPGRGNLSNNTGPGLVILSNGAVVVSGITAEGNGEASVVDNNYQDYEQIIWTPVTISGSSFCGTTGGGGLVVDTTGIATITSLKASGNHGNGLSILSLRAVNLNAITASDNEGTGVYVNNETGGVKYGITLTNKAGANTFNHNAAGLYLRSSGLISLSGLTANLNTTGIDAKSATKTVIVNAITKYNSGVGCKVEGAVAISGLYSQLNGSHGLQLIGGGKSAVVINSVIGGNSGNGVWMQSVPSPLFTGTVVFGNRLGNYYME